MKITRLISAYIRLIPIYEKCLNECTDSHERIIFKIVTRHGLHYGACYASEVLLNISIRKGVYRHYINYYNKYGYIVRPINQIRYSLDYSKESVLQSLKERITFLQNEIPYLQSLIKKGYTHI